MKKLVWLPLIFIIPLFAKIALDGVGNTHYSEGSDQLSLSINVGEGSMLELSDGSVYKIAPKDQMYSKFWVTPFPISVGESGDKEYPIRITNLNTGTSVRGKQITKEELLEESKKQNMQSQPPPTKENQPKPQKPEVKPSKPPEKQ